MKKLMVIQSILCLLLTSCFFLTACDNDAASDDTLVVLNYGKYIESDVLKRFQKETGITVKYEEYESGTLANKSIIDIPK